ncbi:hypothetical protein BKA57DRAFT_497999 [Linnemannia elongata]|nr:hypothetical protein BKA57DRAFT_497999 [Linnemannia elongata]
MLAMNRALVMLDIFGKQIEQQDLDVSATVGSTGSLMLVCSTGGGDCRGSLTDCRPMSGFGRWISLAFLSLPENNTLKLLVIAHNRFGEDGMLTLAHVQPQACNSMINIEPYSKTRSRSPSPSPAPTATDNTTTTTSTEQGAYTSTSSSLTPEATITTATTKTTAGSSDDIASVTNSLSTLTVTSRSSTAHSTTSIASAASTAVANEESKEELSPEEAKLRAQGLKSTHRPGFYIHINSPKRLRIQTSSKTFDLDRYCPHANADMLKWGVLRDNNTLRCGVHYWGFDLAKNGQCIAHPDETLNACPVDSGLEW